MPAAEGLAHFILAAGQPAVVQVPVLYGHSGDVVELVGLAGHEVGHHVAIIAPPLHAGIEGQHAALDLRRREHRAVRQIPRVLRQFRPQQFFANPRVHAVGADDDVGLFRRAVGKVHHHHVTPVFHLGQRLVVDDGAFRQGDAP
ncbi:hypothetical protein G6F57_020152 [Rhizopus arrhizus]|nr:hypothetical protein G6F57_020152 [Rhizopus arrhizus]